MAEYYLYPIFDAPWGTWYPTFPNSNTNIATYFSYCLMFVHYFSNLKFNQKLSCLTDPQKFALTPSFQRRGSIDLQKKEAQETLVT